MDVDISKLPPPIIASMTDANQIPDTEIDAIGQGPQVLGSHIDKPR